MLNNIKKYVYNFITTNTLYKILSITAAILLYCYTISYGKKNNKQTQQQTSKQQKINH